ncbi:MAG: NUDIX domain-containing protein [Candidatus Moraniibacteriota bacterium]
MRFNEKSFKQELGEQGAYALILTKERNVLLQQRNVNPAIENSGKLAMFGGALEDGEDLLDGLKRELFEELELDIDEYRIEKLNTYTKTKELDAIDHLANIWLIYDVNMDALKIHEGESIFSSYPKDIINNPKLTRVTNLALYDLIKKLDIK